MIGDEVAVVHTVGRLVDLRGYDPICHNLFGLDVLHQDERWMDADGIEWRLEDMVPSHRRNLLAFLRRRATRLAHLDAMVMVAGPMQPAGDMAIDACDEAADWQCDHPAEWLEQTKLVRRLVVLVAEHDARLVGPDWWEEG